MDFWDWLTTFNKNQGAANAAAQATTAPGGMAPATGTGTQSKPYGIKWRGFFLRF